MNWRVVFTNVAKRHLRKIPREDARRIEVTVREMEENPFDGDIVKLGGEGDRWRRRIGEYRMMYSLDLKGEIIFIYDIERRTSSTY